MSRFKSQAFAASAIAALGLVASSAQADLVIYEPFAGDAPDLNGDTGGFGLTPTTWSSDEGVTAGTATFGPNLFVSGNRVTFDEQGGGDINIGTVLSDADLIADGKTLWFSVLWTTKTADTNDDAALALGTNALSRSRNNAVPMSGSGSGIGVNLSRNSRVAAATWAGGTKTGGAFKGVASEATHLVVGKITWGATDTVDIYLPGEDLVLPGTADSSTSAVLNQATFNILSFSTKGAGGGIDEIRFGATSGDVLPVVPEPGSLALLGLGGLLIARRRRG